MFALVPFAARGASMLLRPALSSVARGAAETAGQMAASVVGQSAVDHLSTLGSSPAGQIASTVVETHFNMVTGGGPLGALMANLPGQISQVTHLAQNLSGAGTVRPGGTGGQVLPPTLHEGAPPPSIESLSDAERQNLINAGVIGRINTAPTDGVDPNAVDVGGIVAGPAAGGQQTNPPNTTNPNQSIQSVTYPARPGDVGGQPGLAFTTGTNPDGTVSSIQSTLTFNVAPGTVSNPADRAMPHADVIADQIERNRAANAAAAANPQGIARSVTPTPLPVNTAHDALPVLQAQTPMDATGPAATQGAPQPIPPVAPGLRALEVEPTRVYNQDHSAQLPPATAMPTMQHQVVVTSDPPPPPPPGGQQPQGGGSGALLVVGAVTVGGVIIFLWYRQKRA